MSALGIAIGVTSAFFFLVYCFNILRGRSVIRMDFYIWIAVTAGAVWFAARLWWFA